MRILICAALLAAGPTFADSIARQGSDWVRLSLKPCEGKAAEVVKAAGQDPLSFRAATAIIGGQAYLACWIPTNGGAAIAFEDGDSGFVPMGDLKPAPEA